MLPKNQKLLPQTETQKRGLSKVTTDLIRWRILGCEPEDIEYRKYLEFVQDHREKTYDRQTCEQIKRRILSGE